MKESTKDWLADTASTCFLVLIAIVVFGGIVVGAVYCGHVNAISRGVTECKSISFDAGNFGPTTTHVFESCLRTKKIRFENNVYKMDWL
jgi:hypothetical protein